MATTLERLQAILAQDYQLAPERTAPDTLIDNLCIDSLGVAELLFNVEDAFDIKLPRNPPPLRSVGALVHYIDELSAAQHGTPATAAPGSREISPG